jgi:hypothetical protein
MRNTKWLGVFSAFILLLLVVTPVFAQTYLFGVTRQDVTLTVDTDGTVSLDYMWVFANDPTASPIDFVDVGLPNSNYDSNSITANVNGSPITDITSITNGITLGLGSNSIQPGNTGTVNLHVGGITGMIYSTTSVPNVKEPYAHFQFRPSWFGSSFVQGSTDYRFTIVFPPGLVGTEPAYDTPSGWPGNAAPFETQDANGRINYYWESASANGSDQYTFGAAFPARLVASSAVQTAPAVSINLGSINFGAICPWIICIGFIVFFIVIIVAANRNAAKRKLQYLPPKIAMEGHGIKRGLTAVEAAILMERPMDNILMMILFAVIKKNAAEVTTKSPLALKVTDPLPADLYPYEVEFLQSFQKPNAADQRLGLQNMMVNLVKSVSEKMKGFSRAETVAFYQDIIKKAWEQVEKADTPELKSQRFDEVMDWTMADGQYQQRTSQTFSSTPVFLPIWWGRYDPAYHTTSTVATGARPPSLTSGKPSININTARLPGADFAASVVNGTQNLSAGVLGGLSTFTGAVTNKTNPIPVPPPSTRIGGSGGGGGGHFSCACACACAGCACACAGGGR